MQFHIFLFKCYWTLAGCWPYKIETCSYIGEYQSFSCVNGFCFIYQIVRRERNGIYNFEKLEFLDVIRGSVKGNLQALEG